MVQPIALQDVRAVEKMQNGRGWNDDGTAYTVDTHATQGVAQPTIVHGTQDPCVSDIAFAQGRNNGGENVMVQAMAVRRLTPVECERLQGFPDNYTDIKPKGKATPDGPRYKALGNSMAVPVMAWIGKRIQEVDAICQTQKQ
jgi:site-specific DNA-cytosine methylase